MNLLQYQRMKDALVNVRELTLHIGTHKTGSTYIQQFLASNRDTLLGIGWDYTLYGRHSDDGTLINHKHVARSIVEKGAAGEANLVGITRELGRSTKNVLLSSEKFWYCSSPDIMNVMSGHLPPSTTIICFLRNPTSYLLSLWNQSVKSYHGVSTDTFGQYLQKSIDDLNSNTLFSPFHFDRNLDAWRSHFPRVVSINYLKGESDRALIRQFFLAAGIPFEEEKYQFAPPNDPSLNRSISDESSFVILTLNKMFARGVIGRRRLTSFKNYIRSHDAETKQAFDGSFSYEDVDMRSFIKAFDESNPVYRRHISGSGGEMPLPEVCRVASAMAISDADILKRMGVLASSRGRLTDLIDLARYRRIIRAALSPRPVR